MYKKITRSIRECGANRELMFLGYVHTIAGSFCAGIKIILEIEPLFTHKNCDFGVIYVSERSCAVPISIVESHISDRCSHYKAFSHDVTGAILVFQNNKTAAMLVYQENPLGVELVENTSAHQIVPKILWELNLWKTQVHTK